MELPLPNLESVLPPLGLASVTMLILLLEVLVQLLLPNRPERPARVVLYSLIIVGSFFIYLLISTSAMIRITTLHPNLILYAIAIALGLQIVALYFYTKLDSSLVQEDGDPKKNSTPVSAAQAIANGQVLDRDLVELGEQVASGKQVAVGEQVGGGEQVAGRGQVRSVGKIGNHGGRVSQWFFGGTFVLSALVFVFAVSSWIEFKDRVVVEFATSDRPDFRSLVFWFEAENNEELPVEDVRDVSLGPLPSVLSVTPNWYEADEGILILDTAVFIDKCELRKVVIKYGMPSQVIGGEQMYKIVKRSLKNGDWSWRLRALRWIKLTRDEVGTK